VGAALTSRAAAAAGHAVGAAAGASKACPNPLHYT